MDYVFLEGLAVEANIGVLAHEKVIQQPLVLDIKIPFSSSLACYSDDLNDTLDYAEIVSFVQGWVATRRFNLLETMGGMLADELLSEFKLSGLAMTIRKPKIISGLASAGVTLVRGSFA